MLLSEVVEKILKDHCFMYVKQDKNNLYITSSEDKNGFMMLDVATANAINTVYNAISPDRQNKLNNMPLLQAANICWKCVK